MISIWCSETWAKQRARSGCEKWDRVYLKDQAEEWIQIIVAERVYMAGIKKVPHLLLSSIYCQKLRFYLFFYFLTFVVPLIRTLVFLFLKKGQDAAVVPLRVIYIHNRAPSCVETAGMGSSCGWTGKFRPVQDNKNRARINTQARYFLRALLPDLVDWLLYSWPAAGTNGTAFGGFTFNLSFKKIARGY